MCDLVTREVVGDEECEECDWRNLEFLLLHVCAIRGEKFDGREQ